MNLFDFTKSIFNIITKVVFNFEFIKNKIGQLTELVLILVKKNQNFVRI